MNLPTGSRAGARTTLTLAKAIVPCVLLLGTSLASAEEPKVPASSHVLTGEIAGSIESREDGAPLGDAIVTVVSTGQSVNVGADGRYVFRLPPGDYELRIRCDLYRTLRLSQVRVAATQTLSIKSKLDRAPGAIEDPVVVEISVKRESASTQLTLRKNAAASSDAVSAQDIAKTPDRNAADAAKRIVGASVVGSKYVFVRGLGERYTNALFNGSPLPSTEPDRQAVPLDLFPTMVLSDLTIAKTFTPDMPGDFAGGSVNVHTRDSFESFRFQANVALGFNSEATFSNRLSHPGGSLDWLGIDDGTRALPNDIPSNRILRLDRSGNVNPNLRKYGLALNSPMGTDRTFALPLGSIGIVTGHTFKTSKEGKWSVQGALSYGRKATRKNDEIVRTYTIDAQTKDLRTLNDYRAETGIDQVSWSGYAGSAYEFSKNHKLVATGLYSRSSDNETRFIAGRNEESNTTIEDTRLRFQSRALLYGHLRGEHRFPSLSNAELTYSVFASRATLDEPNTRENVYARDPSVGVVWLEQTLSGLHFFVDQSERGIGGSLNWKQPLSEGTESSALKFGGMFNQRARSFNARRFRYLRSGSDPSIYSQPANELFRDENIGSSLTIDEYTRPNDAYDALTRVTSGFAMADLKVGSRVRVVLGQRIEWGVQTIDSYDPFAADLSRVGAKLDRVDLLPSIQSVFKLGEKTNLRAGVARTVARPQLRELAPFSFTEYFGARDIQGNKDLDRTSVLNLDTRFEWFPKVGEVFAASLFAKRFAKPIEPIILPTSQGVESFQNADGATNVGVELEARKKLDFITPVLSNFTLLANASIIYSQVKIEPKAGQVQTNSERPLAGQSPYLVNAAIDFERKDTRIRLSYNVFGPRLAQVGQLGLPDVYEQPRHLLDLSIAQRLSKSLDMKLSFENLLFAPVRFTQADQLVQRFQPGMTAWLSASIATE